MVRTVTSVKSEVRVVLRARIVLAAADGLANASMARELKVDVNTVRTWRRRFAGLGMDGLRDAERSGRPRSYGHSRSTPRSPAGRPARGRLRKGLHRQDVRQARPSPRTRQPVVTKLDRRGRSPREPHHCGIRVPASTSRRACLTHRGFDARAPDQRSANASAPGDTSFSILVDWGSKSYPAGDREPRWP